MLRIHSLLTVIHYHRPYTGCQEERDGSKIEMLWWPIPALIDLRAWVKKIQSSFMFYKVVPRWKKRVIF